MKLSRLCISMEAEKETERLGGYFMMKTYALQMLLLFIRGQEQPRKERTRGAVCLRVGEPEISGGEDHGLLRGALHAEDLSGADRGQHVLESLLYIEDLQGGDRGDTHSFPDRHPHGESKGTASGGAGLMHSGGGGAGRV